MARDFRVFSEQSDYGFSVSLHIVAQDQESGLRFVAKNIEFEVLPEGDIAPPTPLKIKRQHAQALIDELWGMGIRPSQATTGDVLTTQRSHLEDMRQIAFSKLEIAKP